LELISVHFVQWAPVDHILVMKSFKEVMFPLKMTNMNIFHKRLYVKGFLYASQFVFYLVTYATLSDVCVF